MINRVLIRIRVVQILFSYYHNETTNLKKAETELLFSLQKSYDLYFYLLALMIELTEEYNRKVEMRKARLLPTEKDMNPNLKITNNKFIEQLRTNKQLETYLTERPYDWRKDDNILIRSLLDIILKSSAYEEYSQIEEDSFKSDKEFWRKVFKHIICEFEDLHSYLEDESIYWNDDMEIVESFALKTIRQFEDAADTEQLLPMFKEEEDREFAIELLRQTVLRATEHVGLIEKHAANWESERIANMDMLIMQIALAEIRTFPSIPINVSLNEYINISKSYSTEKSAPFINGILDTIVKELLEEKLIFKKE